MDIKFKGVVVAGKGKIEGKIKKVLNLDDIKKVSSESIIITNNNSPLFSIAFLKAKAIISERGGLLCHLAIIAREMNKPCILGVKNILSNVKDDQKIILDCDKGEILLKNEKD